MNILAFDTCLDKMYVCASIKGKILPSVITKTTKEHYHCAFLISTLRDFLKKNALIPNDVDVVAINIGPGSFTGIRACTTVARVFARQLNKKAVGVSSLEILSRINTSHFNPACFTEQDVPPFSQKKRELTLVALDARRETAYAAIYDGKKEILYPQAILIKDLQEMIKKDDYFVITDDKLQGALGGISYQKGDYDLGGFLAEIAQEKLKTDFDTNWQKLLPLYIQPPAVHKGPADVDK